MLNAIENYYLDQKEPNRGCLLALRKIILSYNSEIKELWKYNMPFFYYKNKMFCYVWFHKKFKIPYLGIVEGHKLNHPALLAENRSRIKIILIDPNKDIPVDTISEIFLEAIKLY